MAYSTFVLAKQAGFDLVFQYETQPLKDAELYLVPCASGHRVIHRRRWLELLERVRAGATLYVSHADALFSGFEELTGLQCQTRERRIAPAEISLTGLPGAPVLPMSGPIRLALKLGCATVLGAESDGNPAFTCAADGSGRVYFLSFPLEMNLTTTPGAFHSANAPRFWEIYRHIAASVVRARALAKTSPFLGATEHILDAHTRIAVLVNYSPVAIVDRLHLAEGWSIAATLYGQPPVLERDGFRSVIAGGDALVLTVTRWALAA